MRTRLAASFFFCLLVAVFDASAQYRVFGASDRATGENYNVEVGGFFWNQTPEIFISSESLGIIGSRIDFVEDLGMEKTTHTQLRVVLRPATKHKFRFEYTPVTHAAESVLRRTVVFNGIAFPAAVPVSSELQWRTYRFGYEWDFVYLDRGFVGFLIEAKYTDVDVSLSNASDTEFARARAPIPAIGVIGRGYVVPNISITGEFSFFRLPNFDEDYRGRYFDFDLYGTVNFTDNFGVQGGYRSFDVFYKIDDDEGELTLKGLYFGGVVRF